MFKQLERRYSANIFSTFFLLAAPGYYISLSYLTMFSAGDHFLSVRLSAPVPVLAEGGNEDIEGFSCHYVG